MILKGIFWFQKYKLGQQQLKIKNNSLVPFIGKAK